MGITTTYDDRLLGRAVAFSIGLHLILALFFPALVSFSSAGPAIETISFVRVMRIAVSKPPVPAHQQPALAPKRAPIVAYRRQVHAAVPAVHVSGPVAAPRAQPRAATGAIVSDVSRAGSANAAPAATSPPVTAAPQQIAAAESSRDNGGYMPFGAQQPDPVLDPQVFKALAALGIHTSITVTVDADGHTKAVAFNPPIDAQTAERIRSMLAQASWDPAVCGGGIACEGRTVIKL